MSSTRSINVLIVDDHPLVLEGIRAIIETYSHIEVIGAAASATEALTIASRKEPDVVLMDINMSDINGLDAIELFKESFPKIRILMLSMHDSREYISTSVINGAAGYVLKDVPASEIISAIETVAGGGTYFSSGVSNVLMTPRPTLNSANPLTKREQTVLILVAEGKSSKNVGLELSISTRTVETHRKNIKKKLSISTTAGIIRYAMENGLTG